MRENAETASADEIAQLEEKLAADQEADQAAVDAVKQEIADVANELLEYN